MNWIYNKKQLIFRPLEAYNWLNIYFDVLKNYNIIVLPKEYVLTNYGLQEPFDINFDLFNSFFIEELNKILLNVN
jgi:hypothetical protein